MSGYLFDKRRRKRNFLKYLVIFLIAFVPLVLLNMYVFQGLHRALVIFLDCLILLGFALVGTLIANKIFEKHDSKLEKKIKAREEMVRRAMGKKKLEEMQKRKDEILQQSYNSIRQKKLENKAKVKEEKVGKEDETNDKKDK